MDAVIVSGAGYSGTGILSCIYTRLYFETNSLGHTYKSVQIFHTHIFVQI